MVVGGQFEELDFFERALRMINVDAAMSSAGETVSKPVSVPGCDRMAN
jgi:hypothetical protein